jgi:uncharacterized membrane protein YkvI
MLLLKLYSLKPILKTGNLIIGTVLSGLILSLVNFLINQYLCDICDETLIIRDKQMVLLWAIK